LSRDQILFLDELGAVGQELQQAARTGLLGTFSALHPGHDLEQEDDAQDQRRGRHQDGDHDQLDEGRLPVGQID